MAEKIKGLYKFGRLTENNDFVSNCKSNNVTLKEKLHKMLGHVNFDSLRKFVK